MAPTVTGLNQYVSFAFLMPLLKIQFKKNSTAVISNGRTINIDFALLGIRRKNTTPSTKKAMAPSHDRRHEKYITISKTIVGML